MAYDPNNLSALSYANGFTLWHYRSDDAAATIDTSGYFDAASHLLRAGDFVLTNASVSGAVESGVLIVTQNEGGSVDCANLTPFGQINTD